ncbi:carbohydrate ABC transporter permease [Frankia sp. AgB1.9]|uniref:carbohydrate ABC transporter permease n=1 Tax=unclassified Frankia TaxID=2632575 RepID=UPI001932B6B4|nr:MULTISPECIES: carbohydrate ABC transporter permease [unclassified Frankia]MBL7491420.1 carbohydrate ABC transporter permease [Frankia sp. AgW1.1]MBL7553760.1 carbohydrate ABC transporter permease [Frankia sp. AgB1.9]MBL7618105.1 carbohydrate ABC transporter permease [Frankia sp. AgB1.8]
MSVQSAGPPKARLAWAGAAGRHAVMAVLSLLSIIPIYWMYAGSLRRPGDILSQNPLPWPLSLRNYHYVLHSLDVPVLLANTLVIAAASTVGQLLVCLLAAYAFAAWDFRGKNVLFLLFVVTWLVPFQVTMISNYLVLNKLGLLNSLAGVVVPTLCSALAVLMLRQHMQAFPRELLDAAKIDGRRSWSTLWTVVVPNLRPVLASLAILLFITAWNEYFWPALVLQRANSVIQLGIRGYLTQEGNDWGAIMAASGLACLPIFALYVVLQRQVIDAFVRSGLR